MHLFDRLDVVNVVDGFHLCHLLVVLESSACCATVQQIQGGLKVSPTRHYKLFSETVS